MSAVRVVEAEGLGWDFALCTIGGEKILLVDSETSHEDRMATMADVMGDAY